jgi:hypothetical protein
LKKVVLISIAGFLCVFAATFLISKGKASDGGITQTISEVIPLADQISDEQQAISQQSNDLFLIDEEETPFLAKFRKLYENADLKSHIVLGAYLACFAGGDRYSVRCTEIDIDNMKKLATLKDPFSLAVLSVPYDKSREHFIKQAIAIGEPVTVVWTAKEHYILIQSPYYNESKAEEILESLEKDYPFISAIELLNFYKRTNNKDKFCKTAQNAYNNFGIYPELPENYSVLGVGTPRHSNKYFCFWVISLK